MPRKVTVATTSLQPEAKPPVESNLDKADIVCLPELFGLIGMPIEKWADAAETDDGSTVERIGALAKRFGMYVVCPFLLMDGDRIYNVSLLLDREGRPAGSYRKIHPTISELEIGIVPGEKVEVFETDFGRISMLICFEAAFPERWREAKALGAEIVFRPSAYEGGLPLRSRASDYEFYVVSAVPLGRSSAIIDITGRLIDRTGLYTNVVTAQIDLEKRLFSMDYNGAKCNDILARYSNRVRIHVLSEEGSMTLESHDPGLTVADIVREFDLETQRDYYERSADNQDAAREASVQ